MSFIQQWPTPAAGSTNASYTISGPSTTEGSLLVVMVMVRDNTTTSISLSDSSGNAWQEAGRYVGSGAAMQVMFYAVSSSSISEVTIHTPSEVTATRAGMLIELWAGELVDVAIGGGGDESPTSLVPVDAVAGGMVVGTAVASVSNRTWEGVVPESDTPHFFRGGQMTGMAQVFSVPASGPVSPQWRLTSGSPSSLGVVAAAFGPASTLDPHNIPHRYILNSNGNWVPSITNIL